MLTVICYYVILYLCYADKMNGGLINDQNENIPSSWAMLLLAHVK